MAYQAEELPTHGMVLPEERWFRAAADYTNDWESGHGPDGRLRSLSCVTPVPMTPVDGAFRLLKRLRCAAYLGVDQRLVRRYFPRTLNFLMYCERSKRRERRELTLGQRFLEVF